MFTIIRKESLLSTNSYALELLAKGKISKPTVIVAKSQTKGRGQAENKWFSREGESLTFSVVIFPQKITAEKQFVLSQVVCLSLYETLSHYVNEVAIKWPNDIFINGIKSCGVLIENALMGIHIAHSVCGIGLNVNNMEFSSGYKATSLKKETGKHFEIEEILQDYLSKFSYFYEKAEKAEFRFLNDLYHKYLYKQNEECRFEDKNGVFRAKVIGTDQYGQLLLRDSERQLRTYGFKEVSWLP